jgi:hypothetical protein
MNLCFSLSMQMTLGYVNKELPSEGKIKWLKDLTNW